MLYLDKKDKIDTGSVKFEDHYLDGYFDVTLPGDYEKLYGYGTYDVKGTVVENIEVSTKGGSTTFRFKQNRISAYEVTDEGGSYAIRVKNPKEVYDKVLLLDAGHGGKDPGTSGNGMQEKNLTLTIAQKVEQELQGSGIKVYMTRDRDVYPENSTRAKIANDIADLMVSIHINSGPETANGTETLYQVHANDSSSRLTSKQLAEILQASMISQHWQYEPWCKTADRFVDIESYHSSVSHCGSGFHYQYRGCFEDFQSCLSGSGGTGNCRRYSGSSKEISSAVKLHKLSEKKHLTISFHWRT